MKSKLMHVGVPQNKIAFKTERKTRIFRSAQYQTHSVLFLKVSDAKQTKTNQFWLLWVHLKK